MSSSQQQPYGRRIEDVWRAINDLRGTLDNDRRERSNAIHALDARVTVLQSSVDEMATADEIEKGVRAALKEKRIERYSAGEKLIAAIVAISSLGSLVLGVTLAVVK